MNQSLCPWILVLYHVVCCSSHKESTSPALEWPAPWCHLVNRMQESEVLVGVLASPQEGFCSCSLIALRLTSNDPWTRLLEEEKILEKEVQPLVENIAKKISDAVWTLQTLLQPCDYNCWVSSGESTRGTTSRASPNCITVSKYTVLVSLPSFGWYILQQ